MVDGARLESVYTGNRIVGSNPTFTASSLGAANPTFPMERGCFRDGLVLDALSSRLNNRVGALRRFAMPSFRKLAFSSLMVLAACAPAVAQTTMTIVSGEGCGCCKEWVKHLEANGYKPTISYVPGDKLMNHKTEAGLSMDLTSCHTGHIGGYVIEGHVPAKEIARLLREKPDAVGLTVPGMPYGSPGMGPAEEADPYQVLLIRKDGSTSVYASYP